MKCVVEFGVRGGAHTDNLVVPSMKIAEQMAASLVRVFTNDAMHPAADPRKWFLLKHEPRRTWHSSTHFIAISKLDGVPRGPAANGLWPKPRHANELMDEVVV